MTAEEDHEPRTFTWIDGALIGGIAALLAVIALPNYFHARKSHNEAAAIGALKTITTSESIFREGDKENDGNLDYGMLSELSNTTNEGGVIFYTTGGPIPLDTRDCPPPRGCIPGC